MVKFKAQGSGIMDLQSTYPVLCAQDGVAAGQQGPPRRALPARPVTSPAWSRQHSSSELRGEGLECILPQQASGSPQIRAASPSLSRRYCEHASYTRAVVPPALVEHSLHDRPSLRNAAKSSELARYASFIRTDLSRGCHVGESREIISIMCSSSEEKEIDAVSVGPAAVQDPPTFRPQTELANGSAVDNGASVAQNGKAQARGSS